MAVDLFSLVMNLKTSGTAQVTGELKGVESQGVKTAAALNGLSGTLDRQASATLNNTKGFKDLSGAYAQQDTALKGMAASTAGAAVATETLGSKVKSFALTAVEVAAVGVAFGGLVKFLFDSAKEAANAQDVQVRLQTAVRGAGLEWATYGESLNKASVALQNQTTFTDEDARTALAQLVLTTHDAGKAQQLLGTAADLAAFKHISLAAATEIITRALSGYTRGLREFGITTKDGEEAVAQLGALLAGQASAQAATFDGRIQQLKNSWTEFKEQIGAFVLSSGLTEFLSNSNRELATFNAWLDRIRGKPAGAATQTTADLNARLRDLRAAAAGQAPGFLSGFGGTVAPLTGNALEKNQQEQVAIQNELVDREKARALQVVIAANKQADADDAHVKALADGYKLGTLTTAENAERLTVVKQLREEMAGANLEERNHLQEVINSLTPKLDARLAALMKYFDGQTFVAKAPDDLGSPLHGGNPSLKGPLNLPDVVTATPRGRGRGTGSDTDMFFGGKTFDAKNFFAPGATGADGKDALTRWKERVLQTATEVRNSFEQAGENLGLVLANGFSAALTAGLQGKNVFKAFGNVVLAGLGSIMSQMGQALVAYGVTMVKLLPFLTNIFTSGPAAIVAGLALTALGNALGGAAHGSGGGGGGGGFSASADRVTEIKLTANGAGGFNAPDAKQPFTVLGVETPLGQRVLATTQARAKRRGL